MMPVMYLVTEHLMRRSNVKVLSFLRQLNPAVRFTQSTRRKHDKDNLNISSLVIPIKVKKNDRDGNIGAELSGSLKVTEIIRILSIFVNDSTVKELSTQRGLDAMTFNTVMASFRRYCIDSKSLPTDLHIILSDITNGVGNPMDIYPYFLRFAKQMYPHMDCLDELRKISDLRNPPNWYPIARAKKRRIIFHAGPTNSGKTFHALQRFLSAKSGVYCGPLKLLANEVFIKSNNMGTPCDLVTGEEHRYAKESPSNHISCSVEMANLNNTYEVAVIDEIQLIRDPNRGWAWSRALLGLAADEIHLCGEYAAIPIVQSICITTGEAVEIKEYKRLTELVVETRALYSLENVKPGDCIVCFSRNEIFSVSNAIEKMGKEVAVIYGSLPPGTKLSQAARFNDPKDPCKILVATNAIGMGLNLHIRRIIFYSLTQPTINEKGEMEMDTISVSFALQIAGRAGRYGTQWEKGYVTTYKPEDLTLLNKLLTQSPEIIEQAGLHPTADQIELYAYFLPNAPLSNLINIFVALSELDHTLYFICNLDDFKFLADMIQHIPLPLSTRYVFCCAPVNRKVALTCNMFLKYARQCSNNEQVTITWLCTEIEWPPKVPTNIAKLLYLEGVFDVLDLYLWLSYRMPDVFPDADAVKKLQRQLDKIIEIGVKEIAKLHQKTKEDAGAKEEENKMSQELENVAYGDVKYKRDVKLSNKLIARGLLSPKMLNQLKVEWSVENKAKLKYNKSFGNKWKR